MANQSDALSGESLGLMKEYTFPPYSFLDNPELVAVHEHTLTTCSDKDDIDTVRWLEAMGSLPLDGTPKGPYEVLSDNSPITSNPEGRQLKKVGALLVYTAAKAEWLLRVQSVREAGDVDRGISRITSSALGKLANVYRLRYDQDTGAHPGLLVIAHSLAMYALRFKEPDASGYRQTLGHWLHLRVDHRLPWNRSEEKLKEWEEVMRLAIALEELGPGPQASYVGKCLVPDLIEIFHITGQDEEQRKLEEHFVNIPVVEGEPELWFKGN